MLRIALALLLVAPFLVAGCGGSERSREARGDLYEPEVETVGALPLLARLVRVEGPPRACRVLLRVDGGETFDLKAAPAICRMRGVEGRLVGLRYEGAPGMAEECLGGGCGPYEAIRVAQINILPEPE